jgi:Tfp pilus assembly protein PilZ
MGLMKILYATYKSADEFLTRLQVGEDGEVTPGRVSVATKARYEPGEVVVLEIGFPGLPNRVLVKAAAHKMPVADGLGFATFDLLPGEEHKRNFLVAVASGRGKVSFGRRHQRFPIRLPARFRVEGEELTAAETEDMSTGGMFLRTTRDLPEGTRVSIVLDPLDGSAEMEFSCRVVRLRNEVGEGEAEGVGVQFDRPTSDEMKRLRRMIRDVKLSGKVVEWEAAL